MKIPFNTKALFALPVLATLLAVSPVSAADNGNGNSDAHANDDGNSKSQVQNGRSAIKGNLRTGQHIYYAGDELDISVQFSRGSDLLESGEAEAHIVIFSFDGSLITVPVGDEIGENPRRFFAIENIDISTLPEGQYQLGLVLTVPEGDPALLDDWYSGFRALLDTEAVFVSAAAMEGDDDADGEWDDDTDDDGIEGEEEDDADADDGDEDDDTDGTDDDDVVVPEA